MTFTPLRPGQAITTIVRMAFGYGPDTAPGTWVWTDVSQWVRGGVAISKGKPNQSATADPARVSFNLDNTDGRFSPDNPLSPYWPNVVQNVPVQVLLTGLGDPLVAPYERATAFVDGWPIQPDAGVLHVTVPITASGRLKRLGKGNKPLRSPLYRSVSTLAPYAYWTMEDPSTATQAAPSAGSLPLVVSSGTATFGADGGPGGAASVDFTNGLIMSGRVAPISTSPMSWRLAIAYKWNASTVAGQNANICSIATSTGAVWYIRANSGATWTINLAYNPPGGGGGIQNFTASTWTPSTMGSWKIVEFTFVQNGAGVDVGAHFGALGGFGVSSGFFTPVTLGYPTLIKPGDDYLGVTPDTRAIQMSHVALSTPTVANPSITTPDLASAVLGYAGETADARLVRICAEAGIPLTVSGTSATAMGPQPISTLPAVLQQSPDTDGGLLHDGGPSGNLDFSTLSTRYNATAALTLYYGLGHINDGLGGARDDVGLYNDTVASRSTGATAEAVDSVSLAAVGENDRQFDVNPNSDAQLAQIAAWATHVSAFPATRFPTVGIDLRRSSDLEATVLATDLIGKRLLLKGLPVKIYGYNDVDLFIEGLVETIDVDTWRIDFTCSAGGPYQVSALGDAFYGHIDAASCVLAGGGWNGTAASFTTTTTGPLLSTSGADYPVDLNLSGQRVTVSSVTGGSNPQTVNLSATSVNGVVKTHPAGEPVVLWQPFVLSL